MHQSVVLALAGRDPDPLARLSAGQRNVAIAVGRGFRLATISKRLRRKVQTISTNRSRALKKLGLDTNDDLIRLIARRGPSRICHSNR
jgi:DNA-binding NarL/FixJ family response regulator